MESQGKALIKPSTSGASVWSASRTRDPAARRRPARPRCRACSRVAAAAASARCCRAARPRWMDCTRVAASSLTRCSSRAGAAGGGTTAAAACAPGRNQCGVSTHRHWGSDSAVCQVGPNADDCGPGIASCIVFVIQIHADTHTDTHTDSICMSAMSMTDTMQLVIIVFFIISLLD